MVSAGLVHNRSSEAATGLIDNETLATVTDLTGGQLLSDKVSVLPAAARKYTHFVELTPWLLRLFLLVFLVDVALRRWENLLGMISFMRREAA